MNRINFIKALFIAPIVAVSKEEKKEETPNERVWGAYRVEVFGRLSGNEIVLSCNRAKDNIKRCG